MENDERETIRRDSSDFISVVAGELADALGEHSQFDPSTGERLTSEEGLAYMSELMQWVPLELREAAFQQFLEELDERGIVYKVEDFVSAGQ